MIKSSKLHTPVLLDKVIKFLDPKPGENFVDCTINGGGHALAILRLILPRGRLLGIDRDEEIIKKFSILNFSNQLTLVNDSFVNLKRIVEEHNFKPIHGVLLDLGLSSWHLEESRKGFSFRRNEPLLMNYESAPKKNQRFLTGQGIKNKILTAGEVINNWPEEKLVRIFREYGEERFAGRIAREIVKNRTIKPIKTTFELVDIIKRAIPPKYRYARIHFATRTFQALRIAVNNELENLKKVLPQAVDVSEKGGRLVVISFHSLEDRIVKNFLRDRAKEERLKILTKKPVTPNETEVLKNPRSRSAKLRAAVIT